MGWASLIADSVKNPFTSFLGDSANAIRGVGVGLASGTDLNTGMANAAQYAAQGAQKDDAFATQKKEEAKRQEQLQKAVDNYRNAGMADIADWLSNTGPDGLDLAAQQFWKRKEPQTGGDPLKTVGGQLYNTQTGEWITPPTNPDASNRVSLQGQWGRDANGQPVYLQPSESGSFVQAQVPDGVTLMDPAAMAGAKTSATVDEKTAAAARAALPGAEQMKTITEKALTGVRQNMKGMKEWFSQAGMAPRGMVVMGGTEMGKFIAAASPTNAQAFMQAREMLKGGGQITDFEGRRAEDAISRMQASLDTGDQAQYLEAVTDFESAVMDGYNKLVQTAQGGYSAGAVGGSDGNSGSGWKFVGVEQ